MHDSVVSVLSHVEKHCRLLLSWNGSRKENGLFALQGTKCCLLMRIPTSLLFSLLSVQHTKAINRRQPLRYQLESYEQPARKQTRPVEIDDVAIKVVWKMFSFMKIGSRSCNSTRWSPSAAVTSNFLWQEQV